MAVLDSTSPHQAAAKGGPVTLPVIEIPEIPDSVANAHWRDPWFVISTTGGAIGVTGGYGMLHCRGTQDALCAGGLIAPAWLPGFPGNNRIRQTVVFEPTGPRLLFGKRGGARLNRPHLTIMRLSARTYTVDLFVMPEQKVQLDAINERLRGEERKKLERERQEQEMAVAPQRENDGYPKTPGEARAACVGLMGMAGSLVDVALETVAKGGLRYSDEAMACINRAYGDLRRAFQEGGLGPAAHKFRRDGNVIGWPGRGSVSAVDPATAEFTRAGPPPSH